MDPDLSELERSAFLDVHGRFAKDDEAVAIVRLFFPGREVDLTVTEYRSLSAAAKETIKNTGSGAGFVDTSTTSNA